MEATKVGVLNEKAVSLLAADLEAILSLNPPRYENILDIASRVIALVRAGVPLNSTNRGRLLKCMSNAKEKAYNHELENKHEIYERLDSMSNELVKLL